MSPSLTYVYCLVRSARRPSLRNVPAGMPGGGDVRVLEAPVAPSHPRTLAPSHRRTLAPSHPRTVAPSHPRTLAPSHRDWLIVSSVPEREYGEAALQRGLQRLDWVGRRAVAHEAVVEHFLAAPAVLPMQLFTLFTSDERAVAHVAGDRRGLARILSRIERQHEWGLRLTWDEASARETVERKYEKAGGASRAGKARGAHRPRPDASGASYLARKRDLLDVRRVQLKAARAEADRLYRSMAREASDARRRTETEQAAPGSRLVLDAAFLVPARRAATFRAALRRQTRTLEGSGLMVSLTGPWPAYNFV